MKANVQSDHYPVWFRTKAKYSRVVTKKAEGRPKYTDFTKENKEAYNVKLKQYITPGMSWEQNKEKMEQAAQECFRVVPKAQRKDYISSGTWELIEKRGKLREQFQWKEAEELDKIIKKEAKKDRKRDTLNKLGRYVDQKGRWAEIRRIKS
eukprot:5488367-Lingulodinium_polyedra.AAC.1